MMFRVKRLLLCALLLLAGYAQAGEADLLARIGGQTREIERLNALPACAPMADVLALSQSLDEVAHGWFRRGLRTLAMGLLPANSEVDAVSSRAIRDGLLGSLACRLSLKAARLQDEGASSPVERSALIARLDEIRVLERGLQRFRMLQDGRSLDPERLPGAFDASAVDAYGKAWPEGRVQSPLILRYLAHLPPPVLPAMAPAYRETLAADFRQQAIALREALLGEQTRMIKRLADYLAGEVQGDAQLQQLDGWLKGVQASWLPSSVLSNPCEDLRKLLAPGIDDLLNLYGYPSVLASLPREFETDACYRPVMTQLRQAVFPPYGPLAAPDDGRQVNSAIRRRIQEINATAR